MIANLMGRSICRLLFVGRFYLFIISVLMLFDEDGVGGRFGASGEHGGWLKLRRPSVRAIGAARRG